MEWPLVKPEIRSLNTHENGWEFFFPDIRWNGAGRGLSGQTWGAIIAMDGSLVRVSAEPTFCRLERLWRAVFVLCNQNVSVTLA
jgi:hypothetical protein